MHRDAPLHVFLARSDALKHIHFRLRYQVYCVENDYEPCDAHPQGLERDRLDAHAEHFLVRTGTFNGSGRWIGTMRLIPSKSGSSVAANCGTSSIEVSRLIACDPRHRGSSRVLYFLCQAAQAYAVDHGYAHVAFLIRPALARILARQGLPIEQAGEPCDHRGVRIPYRIDAQAASAALADWRARLEVPATLLKAHYTPMYWPPTGHDTPQDPLPEGAAASYSLLKSG